MYVGFDHLKLKNDLMIYNFWTKFENSGLSVAVLRKLTLSSAVWPFLGNHYGHNHKINESYFQAFMTMAAEIKNRAGPPAAAQPGAAGFIPDRAGQAPVCATTSWQFPLIPFPNLG